ncbi:MAG: ribulose-phosphate 3-epimerase [Bacteroidales bacterium]|nr:ribulose-phosphate 3-epimerase [Bacteroidales bacterium]
MSVLLAPSILAADFLNLGAGVELVNEHADIFHLDVMDGILVPNLSFGFPVVDAIAKKARKPLDVHLMIVKPWNYFQRFAKSGAHMISFHLEAARLDGKNASDLLKELKGLGVKAGLAINPDIPVEDVFPYLDDADFVLIMSVFAGFGGQKFMPESIERIEKLKAELTRRGLADKCKIEVDGGVGAGNSADLAKAGAEILVAGSSVFRAENPAEACVAIKHS